MLYAFFDETEDNGFFIVGGVISSSKETLSDVIYETRKHIKSGKKGKHYNALLNEIKEYYIYRNNLDYVKKRMFSSLSTKKVKKKGKIIDVPRIDVIILYMKYTKGPDESLKQAKKSALYLEMIGNFLSSEKFKDEEICIVYDDFEDKAFKKGIRDLANSHPNLVEISSGKSNEVKELQIADVCVGSYRRKLNNDDKNNNFGHIEDLVHVFEYEKTY
ncbi:DUF3800 domain-containing protein [Priestia flexa]|uniref:DUF3800 domain-containing protein n=2 Tax=Bacilli TaxID=91061 RepID=A0ABU4JBN5_9BACI|nr:DUF3800 domain-containing protein [Priestia flexa]MDW8518426.1 DUF3800 domain-containing protein [Priestia flexa]QCS51135.1 hypothetical protein FED53_00035 [Priestia flexa]